MRTTININDPLRSYAKHQAVQQGCTLKKQVVEDALCEFLSRQSIESEPVKLKISIVSPEYQNFTALLKPVF